MLNEKLIKKYLSNNKSININITFDNYEIHINSEKTEFLVTVIYNKPEQILQYIYNNWDEAYKAFQEQCEKCMQNIVDTHKENKKESKFEQLEFSF